MVFETVGPPIYTCLTLYAFCAAALRTARAAFTKLPRESTPTSCPCASTTGKR